MVRYALLFLVIVTLTACGGGGGGGGGDSASAAGGSSGATAATVGGLTQKGPFEDDATVRAYKLDGVDAEGNFVYSQAVNGSLGSLGSLSISAPWSGPTLVEVEGYFFDENTGARSSFSARLHNIVDLTPGYRGNVNLFTHLLAARTRALMAPPNNNPFRDAMDAARRELIGILGLAVDAKPDQLDVTQGGSGDNASLLLFSAAVGMLPNPGQHKIAALAEDFATDGSPGDSFAEVRQATQGIVLENLRHPARVTEPTPTTVDLGDPTWVTGSSPTITSSSITAATQDQQYVYDVDAQGLDAGDSLTYSLTTAPAGMTIDNTTGLITWTPNNAQVGDRQVTVRVTDTDGLSAQRA